jgi:quercetin dioxygenase-like cupin family protein
MRPLWIARVHDKSNRRTKQMKRTLLLVGFAGAVLGAWCIGRVQGQADANKIIFATADKANYTSGTNGISTAAVWGDANVGAHGTFTKFPAGYDAGLHIHTNDVWIVGIKGAYLYKDEAGEKRVGPGDFLRIPGGHKHWSGGDKKEGALFYDESSGKFDLIPAK